MKIKVNPIYCTISIFIFSPKVKRVSELTSLIYLGIHFRNKKEVGGLLPSKSRGQKRQQARGGHWRWGEVEKGQLEGG